MPENQMSQEEEIRREVRAAKISVGTQVKTTFMRPFITKADQDGLYMMDLDMTMGRARAAAKFANRVGTDQVIVCSGRQYASTPVEKFCELTGAKSLLGRFMPGTLTNPSLPYYIEPRLLIASDPQVDEQAITEATNAGIPVICLSDTDNITSKVDLVIPANNRGPKSLAAAYWLLAREMLIDRGELEQDGQMRYAIDDFETVVRGEEAE